MGLLHPRYVGGSGTVRWHHNQLLTSLETRLSQNCRQQLEQWQSVWLLQILGLGWQALPLQLEQANKFEGDFPNNANDTNLSKLTIFTTTASTSPPYTNTHTTMEQIR